MKLFKNVIALLLSGVILTGSVMTVSASNNDITKIEESPYQQYYDEEVSDTFIDFYSSFFKEKEKFNIYDSNGNDVTEKFYNSAIKFYNSRDFNALKKYVLDNNILGGKEREVKNVNLPQTRAFMTNFVNERYFYNLNKHPAAGELEYYISGTYSWDMRTGKIESSTAPLIKITKASFGAMWSTEVNNMRANFDISPDKFSVHYYGSFTFKAILGFSIKDFPIGWSVDFGSFSASATGEPYYAIG